MDSIIKAMMIKPKMDESSEKKTMTLPSDITSSLEKIKSYITENMNDSEHCKVLKAELESLITFTEELSGSEYED